MPIFKWVADLATIILPCNDHHCTTKEGCALLAQHHSFYQFLEIAFPIVLVALIVAGSIGLYHAGRNSAQQDQRERQGTRFKLLRNAPYRRKAF